jgi:hypothetical protein
MESGTVTEKPAFRSGAVYGPELGTAVLGGAGFRRGHTGVNDGGARDISAHLSAPLHLHWFSCTAISGLLYLHCFICTGLSALLYLHWFICTARTARASPSGCCLLPAGFCSASTSAVERDQLHEWL